jgi:dihydrofolate reductase
MYTHWKLLGHLAQAIGGRALVKAPKRSDGPSEAGPVITRSTTPERRTTMRKLIESTLVSLDGVTEAPERWTIFDAEATAYSIEQLGNYDAFVMGRVTYEQLYAYWGQTTGDPYIDRINAMPKYVASRSPTQTAWNATLLGPDPSSAIARLKDQPGKDLIKYGTSRLDDTLVRDHLIDEFHFWIMPVIVGSGRRLFEHVDTSGLHLRLTGERRLENGSVILTYAPRLPGGPDEAGAPASNEEEK